MSTQDKAAPSIQDLAAGAHYPQVTAWDAASTQQAEPAPHIEAWTWFDASGEYRISRDEPEDGAEVYQLVPLVAMQALASTQQAEPVAFTVDDVDRIRDCALAVFHGGSQEARDVIEWYHGSLRVEVGAKGAAQKAEPAQAAVPAPKADPVAEFRGRRQTPEGTVEFWGVMLCDPMQDPPKGSKLYAGPINDPVPRDWRSVIPGGRFTDKWESARIADFNEGWNAYRKAVIAALAAQPKAEPVQPAEADTVQLVGVKADGTEHVLGTATMPPKMKARELVRDMFNTIDEETGNDGAMAYWVCEQLIEWMEKTPPVFNVASPAPAQAPLTDEQIVRSLEAHGVEFQRFMGGIAGTKDCWTTAGSQDVRKLAAGVRALIAAWGVKLEGGE